MTRTEPDCAARTPARCRFRRGWLAALFMALLTVTVPAACAPPTSELQDASTGERREEAPAAEPVVYEGAWFTITAPAGFTARPSLASETADGYDSVFFDAPDGRVAFYVCSPQWGRQATDVDLDPTTENLLAESQVERGADEVERREIAALDGSYRRLVEIVFSPASGAQWTFGFRWADATAREEHLEAYERFKASLEQYAD